MRLFTNTVSHMFHVFIWISRIAYSVAVKWSWLELTSLFMLSAEFSRFLLLWLPQYPFLKALAAFSPFVLRKKSKERRVSLRARPQSVGHMEVLPLLPVSSWTVLVSLVTQELSYHPRGSDEKWRDEEGVTHLTVAPVHQAKFLPTNTSVLSISCKSKQADCVYGQGREWSRHLRRIRSIRAKCIQVTREEETLTISLKDKCFYFLKSYQQSAGLQENKRWRLFAHSVHDTFTQENGKRHLSHKYQENRDEANVSSELIHTWCRHQKGLYTWCIHTCQKVSWWSQRWASNNTVTLTLNGWALTANQINKVSISAFLLVRVCMLLLSIHLCEAVSKGTHSLTHTLQTIWTG